MYDEVYKCRLCGAVFFEGSTSVRKWAIKWSDDYCSGRQLQLAGTPAPQAVHFCDDKSIGVADFQGYKKDPKIEV